MNEVQWSKTLQAHTLCCQKEIHNPRLCCIQVVHEAEHIQLHSADGHIYLYTRDSKEDFAQGLWNRYGSSLPQGIGDTFKLFLNNATRIKLKVDWVEENTFSMSQQFEKMRALIKGKNPLPCPVFSFVMLNTIAKLYKLLDKTTLYYIPDDWDDIVGMAQKQINKNTTLYTMPLKIPNYKWSLPDADNTEHTKLY